MLEPITCYLLPKYLLTKLGASCGAVTSKAAVVAKSTAAKGTAGIKAGSVAATKAGSATATSGVANAT